MPTCLVLLDAGVLDGTAAALVGAARRLGTVVGVWVGDPPDGLAAAAGALGVTRVLRAVPDTDQTGPAVVADCVARCVADSAADSTADGTGVVAVLLPVGPDAAGVAARVAVATGGAAVTDATDVDRASTDGRVLVTKPVLAGTWTTTVEAATPATVTVKPHAVPDTVPAAPVTAEAVEVVEVPVACGPAARAAVTTRTVHQGTGRPSLTSADVVVVAGRGVDGDMSPVTDLADILGAAVGATRVVVDEGWADHDTLVGQTGVSVAPRLYIGAGVSGQVHHVVGMQAAGTVVAVCTDPDAPIFEQADYGIVGDVAAVLPALAEQLRRRRPEAGTAPGGPASPAGPV